MPKGCWAVSTWIGICTLGLAGIAACGSDETGSAAAGAAGTAGTPVDGGAGAGGATAAGGGAGTDSGSGGAGGATAGSGGSGGTDATGGGAGSDAGSGAGNAGAAGMGGTTSDGGLDGPTGACTNPSDMAILNNPTNLGTKLQTCAAKNFGQEPATLNCIQESTGLSSPCAVCFDASVQCVMKNCMTQCMSDPNADACTECRNQKCDPEFAACSGLAPQ